MKFRIDARLIIGMALGSFLTVMLLIAAIAVSYFGYYDYAMKRNEENLGAPPIPGTKAADFDWSLTSLEGEPLEFASLKGDVIFMTFWSPECPHCKIEMGYIQELYDAIAEEGVRFVCATSDKYREQSQQYIAERGLTMPFYTYEGGAPGVYKHRITPAAFIIGRDGTIAWSHEGAARWSDESTIQYLRGLLIKDE